eukprot:5554131-Pyramimonas_sp.AAC.1
MVPMRALREKRHRPPVLRELQAAALQEAEVEASLSQRLQLPEAEDRAATRRHDRRDLRAPGQDQADLHQQREAPPAERETHC